MVNVTIDDKQIEVAEGTTVLQAARQANVVIPTLCDHPHLTPYGGCRLCLVEVEGLRTLQPSCTLPVNNNMVVHTNTDKVLEARKFVLTLIFSERNHFCMYCQKSGGDCELQNRAYDEGMTHWPLQPNWQPYPVDASHPDFVLDHNRCILCRRCVRACGELVGNFTLGFEERGANSVLVADLGVPLGESSCVGCGTCVQVCPTGSLIDRSSAYMGHETQVQVTPSTCVGCSVGCGMNVITRDNQLLRVEGNWDSPVSEGLLCNLGRYKAVSEEHERVLTPQIRKNGSLKAATWEEALGTIRTKLGSLAGKDGAGVAAIASGRLPSEALYAFKKLFADCLGSTMVTSTSEGLSTTLGTRLARELGYSFEGKLEQLKAADLVLAVGADLAENHQVAGFFVKRNLPKGTRLIVVNPGETALDDLADQSLKLKPGTDADLLNGLAAELVRSGLAKGDPGFDSAAYPLDRISQVTGVSAEALGSAAKSLAAARQPVLVYGKGLSGKVGYQALKALVALARALGVLDQLHSALIGIKGQANSLAASLYGLDLTLEITNQQAVYLAAADEVISPRLLQSIEKVPFKVVQSSFVSPATAIADVVLPVEMWSEQDGHYLSLDGRLQAAHRAVTAPDGVWSNELALQAVAQALDVEVDAGWEAALRQAPSPVAISIAEIDQPV